MRFYVRNASYLEELLNVIPLQVISGFDHELDAVHHLRVNMGDEFSTVDSSLCNCLLMKMNNSLWLLSFSVSHSNWAVWVGDFAILRLSGSLFVMRTYSTVCHPFGTPPFATKRTKKNKKHMSQPRCRKLGTVTHTNRDSRCAIHTRVSV